MGTCDTCKANKICDHNQYSLENCNNYIPLGGVHQPIKNPFVEDIRKKLTYDAGECGEWYVMSPAQKRAILRLCDMVEIFENTADHAMKMLASLKMEENLLKGGE